MINYTVNQHIAIITWAMTSSPMNVLNDESIPQFEAALEQAFADESVKGIIITSAKPEFVAGADLKMILRNNELNVNGGAIALGHPLGATGAIISATLIDELERSNKQFGLATLCIGGGMGIATIFERMN